MIDQTLHDRVHAAAENAWLRLLGRWSMVTALPAVIGAGFLIGREIIAATNANTIQLARIEERLIGLEKDLKGNVAMLSTRLDTQSDRMSNVDKRNDLQDLKIDDVTKRVYQLPLSRIP